MHSSSSKPKFSFNLIINDLTNVPQINGSCFIELQIKDGGRHHSDSKVSKSISSTIMAPSTTSRTFLNKFDDFTTSLSTSQNSGMKESTTSSLSGNVSATTSRKKLHNFKCNFNYKLSCNLKFNIRKKGNLVANKYLLLKIFYVNDASAQSFVGGLSQITELGRLEINLSEYLNFDDMITTKYLLNDSKVNSILSLTIGLNELPPNFDFHTQLQIQDNQSSVNSRTDTSNLSSRPTTRKNNFNVPQFEKKNIFNGINNVFGENGTFNNSPPSSPSTPVENGQAQLGSVDKSKTESNLSLANNKNGGQQEQQPKQQQQQQQILMDPIVSQLYCKILESSWDPELYTLLTYSPEQCIDDIFNNPKNKYGYNLKLKEYYEARKKDDEEEMGNLDDSYRELNGLISEVKYRPDLKSWNIPEGDLPR